MTQKILTACDSCQKETKKPEEFVFYVLIIQNSDNKTLGKAHICAECAKKPLDLKKILDSLKLSE